MTNIITTTTEDKRTLYKLMRGNESVNFKDYTDIPLEIAEYVHYREDADGKDIEMLAILTSDGKVIAGQSETLRNEFFMIKELMGEEEYSIVIYENESKAGRKFVNCKLV